jgi:pilus assembly protein CpaE
MTGLFIVLSDASLEAWARDVAHAMGIEEPWIMVGNPASAAEKIIKHQITPSHIVLELGSRGSDVLPEVDVLGEQCVSGTRVVAVGNTNDIQLYRALISRGVIDYLPTPVSATDVVKALQQPSPAQTAAAHAAAHQPAAAPRVGSGEKRIITMMSAASGDGASTIALNTAYEISQLQNGRTVLVDMDYQFGMVAKNINLQSQYGIKDLFEHPERGIDTTLIRRMVVKYGQLDVIAAPGDLRFLPNLSAQAIPELLNILKQSYDTIILDLPHVWLPWVATCCQYSNQQVLIAQLWLKSVTHSARLLKSWREHNVPMDQVRLVINRSGAKFKEAIEPKDFERVCNVPIRHTITNDIKSVVMAEGEAKTIMELPPSKLQHDIGQLARMLIGEAPLEAGDGDEGKGGLLGAFSRFAKGN